MTKHSKEPWTYDELTGTLRTDNDYIFACIQTSKANADHIVACVNACAGLKPEKIAAMVEAAGLVCRLFNTWLVNRESADAPAFWEDLLRANARYRKMKVKA